jgi:predicted dehydrogenase
LPKVDVATTHNAHHAAARTCLEAGRAVLVEKPFTTNAADAADLVALARERSLFAMEAMWTRFNPLIARLRDLVADGAIGEVKAVYADFSENFPFDASHRLWAPALAGGALLDLGVYPVSFAWMLLGEPATVQAVTTSAPTGVETYDLEVSGQGYTYQAEEVARCIGAGLTESPVMPLDESVAILRALDTIAGELAAQPAAKVPAG